MCWGSRGRRRPARSSFRFPLPAAVVSLSQPRICSARTRLWCFGHFGQPRGLSATQGARAVRPARHRSSLRLIRNVEAAIGSTQHCPTRRAPRLLHRLGPEAPRGKPITSTQRL
jgi:hypothetical protein